MFRSRLSRKSDSEDTHVKRRGFVSMPPPTQQNNCSLGERCCRLIFNVSDVKGDEEKQTFLGQSLSCSVVLGRTIL